MRLGTDDGDGRSSAYDSCSGDCAQPSVQGCQLPMHKANEFENLSGGWKLQLPGGVLCSSSKPTPDAVQPALHLHREERARAEDAEERRGA